MTDYKLTTIDSNIDFETLPWWDVIIIGAGPAGLAASLTTAHRALTTLVIEAKDSPGGQPHFLYADKKIVDIPGVPEGITGEELSERTYRQATDAHVQFRFTAELTVINDSDQIGRRRRPETGRHQPGVLLMSESDPCLRAASLSAKARRP